jgi:hypothetical protein
MHKATGYFFAGLLSAIIVPVGMFIALTFFSIDARHYLLRTAAELPAFATYFMVRKSVMASQYSRVNTLLGRQLDLVLWLGPRENVFLPGLIENAKYAFNSAYTRDEIANLAPFAERLVEAEPDLYPARVWAALAISLTNSELALKHLERAVKLSGTEPAPYRIAIEIAHRNQNHLELQKWCSRYATTQSGGGRPRNFNNLFEGTGIKRMALEAINADGESQIADHHGISLNNIRDYSFEFSNPLAPAELRLHTNAVIGTAVKISAIKVLRSGVSHVIPISEIVQFSREGAHLEDGWVLSTGKYGQTLKLVPASKPMPQFDTVVMTMKFKRLNLSTPNLCAS